MQLAYTTVTKEVQNIMTGMRARLESLSGRKTVIHLIAAMQNKLTQGK